MSKTTWKRIYKSAMKPIYIYEDEGNYKVHAYGFYPRKFSGETAKFDCLNYVNSFGEGLTKLN